jgi:predicted MPP superfamily phosphohydrolase
MGQVSWLHLSDWHHKIGDRAALTHDRLRKRDPLIKDIKNRSHISPNLETIDFILFSGDIANGGAKEEFDEVRRELIEPILDAVGKTVPIYCVPGNHDIERARINDIRPDLRKKIAELVTAEQWEKFDDDVTDPKVASELNKPFANYYDFLEGLGCKVSRDQLYNVYKIDAGGIKIGLLCLNTAWNSARYTIQHRDPSPGKPPPYWDYGLLRITEAQLQHAIKEVKDADLVLLMMHHPLHWIEEWERGKLEQMLFKSCHIVIHGHEHRPNTSQIYGAFGDLVFIPAGATHLGRGYKDPRNDNAYNYVTIDAASFCGTIHHRLWMEQFTDWKPDDRLWMEGRSQFVLPIRKAYDLKLAHKAIYNANKQYNPAVSKRALQNYEISISHVPVTIDGERFIRQSVEHKVTVRSGQPENLTFSTQVEEMIVSHPNAKISSRAYKLMALDPRMKSTGPGSAAHPVHKYSYSGRLEADQQKIVYAYEQLDLPSNFYYASVSRFTEQFKLTLKKAKGYEYFFLSIGGFPELQPVKDNVLKTSKLETNEMILPSQGYLIQWRPEHRAASAAPPAPAAPKPAPGPRGARARKIKASAATVPARARSRSRS